MAMDKLSAELFILFFTLSMGFFLLLEGCSQPKPTPEQRRAEAISKSLDEDLSACQQVRILIVKDQYVRVVMERDCDKYIRILPSSGIRRME